MNIVCYVEFALTDDTYKPGFYIKMFKLKDKFKDCLMSISNFDCDSATILEQN